MDESEPNVAAVPPSDESASRTSTELAEISVLWSLVGTWTFPATIARRTQSCGLWSAWIMHVASVVLGTATILYLIAWSRTGYGGLDWTEWEFFTLVTSGIQELHSSATGAVLPLLGIFLLVEGIHFGVALLAMPWGARDERLRSSFKNSLRQTWLHTSHFLAGILIVGGVAIGLDISDRNWEAANPPPVIEWPPYPTLSSTGPNDPNYARMMADYRAALERYRIETKPLIAQLSAWQAQRPVYLQNPVPVIILAAWITVAWILWALFRAVGASRQVCPIDRPPMCLECGYNLHTLPMEGRCPECGQPVAASIGPDAQPGAPWQYREETGWLSAWRRTATQVICQPADFGRRLRLEPWSTDHRGYFALHLPAIGLIAAVAVSVGVIIVDGWDGFVSDRVTMLFGPAMFGMVCCALAVGLTLLVAWVAGVGLSRLAGRNLLAASMQAASYLISFVVLCQIFSATVIIAAAALDRARFFKALEDRFGINDDFAMFVFVALPLVCMGIYYYSLVHRATAAARYANR